MFNAKQQNMTKKVLNSVNHSLIRSLDWIQAKTSKAMKFSRDFSKFKPLEVPESTFKYIRQQFNYEQIHEISAAGIANSTELQLCDSIRMNTDRMNRNNITRAQAYYDIYRAQPELHWALLAHMVSRNSGWNMTDLKGEMLPHLLNQVQTEDVFQMLERANSLIFQDAYPQLLLYQECKQRGQNLFHLLDHFHVSRFMRPFWNCFWKDQGSIPLTIALIVNEQNYIEKRIVKNQYFIERVFQTIFFQSQALLQWNQIIFPYVPQTPSVQGKIHFPSINNGHPKLIGIILEDFTDLNERIEFGKKLYNLLFGSTEILKQIEAFANSTRHTGSRADYWPQLFSKLKKTPLGKPYQERLKICKLVPGADPLYSPELEQVWKDKPIYPIERFDWFSDLKMLRHIQTVRPPFTFEMTEEHCNGLNKIELAVIANQKL